MGFALAPCCVSNRNAFFLFAPPGFPLTLPHSPNVRERAGGLEGKGFNAFVLAHFRDHIPARRKYRDVRLRHLLGKLTNRFLDG